MPPPFNPTPGLWEYKETSLGYKATAADPDFPSARQCVVFVPRIDTDPHGASDARLCAAAPTLLELVRVAADVMARLVAGGDVSVKLKTELSFQLYAAIHDLDHPRG